MINFDLGEHYKKDGMKNTSLRRILCPNFVQVLDYSIFKGVEHYLKPFFPTNKKLMTKGEVQQPAPVFFVFFFLRLLY